MLIPFQSIVKKYGINPKGVLHVGGSTGQECEAYYANGVKRTIWIEAIPSVFAKLVDHIQHYPNTKAYRACISDKEETVTLNISSNDGESSSILKFGVHAQMHPDVTFVDSIEVTTVGLKELLKHEDLSDYDFLNLDIQGMELPALKSLGDLMNGFKYVYCEVNKAETYEGCALVGEIDEYLAGFGFIPHWEKWVEHKGKPVWGDKFYMSVQDDVEKMVMEFYAKNGDVMSKLANE